jgi:UDP-MurNAc hydroxylase
MKIVNVASSSVIVETKNLKILMDPWLVDGEYYGSWYHYPKIEIDKIDLESITHIYLSHIHPDHFSIKSFELLNRDIPVFIHNYDAKFLKNNIERLGFNVIELDHGLCYKLSEEVNITIFAADNCNPELCNKFLGCSNIESNYKSTQIDSMALISDGQYNLLNTNDCPFELSIGVVDKIMSKYNSIDFLLVGYCGAGPYPQCFNMESADLEKAKEAKMTQFLESGTRYLEKIKPKFYMPFAGTYVLSGSLVHLNKQRGIPELHEALEFYDNFSFKFGSKGVLLNQNQYFDLSTGNQSKVYQIVDYSDRDKYIYETLSKVKFNYQEGDNFSEETILSLVPNAFDRLIKKKGQIGFNTDTKLFIKISENNDLCIDFFNNSYIIVPFDYYKKTHAFVRIDLDNRLLYRLLSGPKFGHWNNAEIGSHLLFERNPNIFERGLYHVLSFFHI